MSVQFYIVYHVAKVTILHFNMVRFRPQCSGSVGMQSLNVVGEGWEGTGRFEIRTPRKVSIVPDIESSSTGTQSSGSVGVVI